MALYQHAIYKFRLLFYFFAACGIVGAIVGMLIAILKNDIGVLLSSLVIIAISFVLVLYVKKISHKMLQRVENLHGQRVIKRDVHKKLKN